MVFHCRRVSRPERKLSDMAMTQFLGKHISELLGTSPFAEWPFRTSAIDQEEEHLISYVFEENGMEIKCDSNRRIETIFLHAEELGGFDESLLDFLFTNPREHVREHLGTPSRCREGFTDETLGKFGPWDRYDYADPNFSAHFQYTTSGTGIKMFTLMRGDVVPGYRK